MTRALRLAAWVAAASLALVALAASGHGALAAPPLADPERWAAWFAQRDPAAAAVALLRMAAIVGCWYLAGVTLLGTALRLVRADVLVAVADRITVAPVRRMLAGSVTLTLATFGPTGMLAAVAQPAPSTSTSTTTSTSSTVPGPITVTMRRLPPPAAEPDAAPPVTAPGPQSVAGTWTVQPGDCFWTIADDLLQRAWGRTPSDGEIVPYWLRLIEANRAELADPGNPDLIFPGQVFAVPPLPRR